MVEGLTDFHSRFSQKLQQEFGATEDEARRIAAQAERFLDETESEETVDSLIKRMQKRRKGTLEGTWNSVVGFLHAESWDIGGEDGGDNPYKL